MSTSAAHPAPIGVITNPNSKKNRARRDRRGELARILGERGVVFETRTTADIVPAVREMLARDVRYWVSDGGDGALHWLLNEARPVFAEAGLSLPLTVPTNGGTIDFVAKKVGIQGQADEVLAALVRAEESGRALPVEDVPTFIAAGERVDEAGRLVPFERVGFTAAVCGVGQRFFDRYYEEPLPGPDTVVRVIAKGVGSIALNAPLLRALPLVPGEWREYAPRLLRPQEARVTIDGRALPETSFNALHVGAMYVDIGGVVKLFPLAGEGLLHLMYGSPSMPQILWNLPSLFLGTPMGWGLAERAVREVTIEALGAECLRPCIDGELFPGIRRVTLTAGPRVRIPRVDGRGARRG
jgi:hypothetical protein